MGTPEKTAIVLLPGMDGTGELLRTLADQLSAHRPVQLIGYPVDRSLTYEQLVAYVRERVPNDRFVILGESFSGPIAIEIAATDSRVVGLVLASSFARHPLPTRLAAFTRLLDLRWIPTSIVVAALMGSAATPRLRVRLRQVLATLPREIIRARAQEVLRVDKRGRLRDIKCPVLCLHGRSDRMVSKRRVDEIVAALPGCQLRWLDSSHMLLATHAKAAAGMIEDFCKLHAATGLDIP
jgi:pimeloyl-[acyl-carrier protein] methyl ester esterase